MNVSGLIISKKLAIGLWLCLALFVLRVLAQFLVYWVEVPFLPPFNFWYSGAISYSALLGWQFLIILLMVLFAVRFTKGLVIPHRGLGIWLQSIGILYFSVMFIRLVISLLGISELIWFNRPIPSFFHLILASYLIIAGRYHLDIKVKK